MQCGPHYAHQYLFFIRMDVIYNYSHLSGRQVASWSCLICWNIIWIVIIVLLHPHDGEAQRVGRDGVGVTLSLVQGDIIGVIVISKHTEQVIQLY